MRDDFPTLLLPMKHTWENTHVHCCNPRCYCVNDWTGVHAGIFSLKRSFQVSLNSVSEHFNRHTCSDCHGLLRLAATILLLQYQRPPSPTGHGSGSSISPTQDRWMEAEAASKLRIHHPLTERRGRVVTNSACQRDPAVQSTQCSILNPPVNTTVYKVINLLIYYQASTHA